MSGPWLFHWAMIGIGVSTVLWVAWFFKRTFEDDAAERASQNAEWTASFESFEEHMNHIIATADSAEATWGMKLQNETRFDNWQDVFDRLIWPRELRADGRPLVAWAAEIEAEQTTLRRWGLWYAAVVRDGNTEFNERRKKVNRLLEQWVLWSENEDFKDRCDLLVRDHRTPLVFFLYLEFREAQQVRSPRAPSKWADLSKRFPILQATVASVTPSA